MADIEEITRVGFFKKYRVLMQEAFDIMAEYEERARIFERLDIPRNHYYNVTNEFRSNPAKTAEKEHPYHIPLEFIIKTIVGMSEKNPHKYDIAKEFCKDIGCTVLTPKEKTALREILKDSAPDPMKVLNVLQELLSDEGE